MDRGEKNCNPGNINKGQNFKGEVTGSDPRFATFVSPQMGIRAIAYILLVYYNEHGLNTITSIINRWAPPGENNTSSYITDVCNRAGYTANEPLNLTDQGVLRALVTAIIWHENGEDIYSDQTIAQGVALAV